MQKIKRTNIHYKDIYDKIDEIIIKIEVIENKLPPLSSPNEISSNSFLINPAVSIQCVCPFCFKVTKVSRWISEDNSNFEVRIDKGCEHSLSVNKETLEFHFKKDKDID